MPTHLNLKKRIKRYNLIAIHQHLVKEGKFLVAKRLLHFLQVGNIILDLSDADYELESILENTGCKMCYLSNRFMCEAYL